MQGPRSLEVLEVVTDGPMPERFNYFNMAEVLICWVTTSFPVVADCATTTTRITATTTLDFVLPGTINP